jgi:hypothetical protein
VPFGFVKQVKYAAGLAVNLYRAVIPHRQQLVLVAPGIEGQHVERVRLIRFGEYEEGLRRLVGRLLGGFLFREPAEASRNFLSIEARSLAISLDGRRRYGGRLLR